MIKVRVIRWTLWYRGGILSIILAKNANLVTPTPVQTRTLLIAHGRRGVVSINPATSIVGNTRNFKG